MARGQDRGAIRLLHGQASEGAPPDGQRERVNMMLIGPQPVGSWVLTSLGLAKEVVEDEQRQLIEDALSALAASLEGDFDPSQHFQDLSRPHD